MYDLDEPYLNDLYAISVVKEARDGLRRELYTQGLKSTQPVSKPQADAGNYRKGHVNIHGFRITIEVGKGQTRKGFRQDGSTWERKMTCPYGYIRGTQAKDSDHVDCFIGDNPKSEIVFIIDQVNPSTGKFDEFKVVLGADTLREAKSLYKDNYPTGWSGMGSITPATLDQFKAWLQHGDMKRPYAEQTFRLTQPTETRDKAVKMASVPALIVRISKSVQIISPRGARVEEGEETPDDLLRDLLDYVRKSDHIPALDKLHLGDRLQRFSKRRRDESRFETVQVDD